MAFTDKLTAIADAIRAKGGTTDLLTLDGMVEAINAIEIGGPTDVTDSVVSVAFSATNAAAVLAGFNEIIPKDAKITTCWFQGDLSNVSNNHCLLVTFSRVYSESHMMYIRWRNNSYDIQGNNSSLYDLVVNAGDTYRMVVIQ